MQQGRSTEIAQKATQNRGQAQRFLSAHSSIYNTFNIQRYLISRKTMRIFRSATMAEWSAASAETG